jgi:hypothetical protein
MGGFRGKACKGSSSVKAPGYRRREPKEAVRILEAFGYARRADSELTRYELKRRSRTKGNRSDKASRPWSDLNPLG